MKQECRTGDAATQKLVGYDDAVDGHCDQRVSKSDQTEVPNDINGNVEFSGMVFYI